MSEPVTAPAHFAIEVSGAKVWRTDDSQAHVVVPNPPVKDVYVVGTRAGHDLIDIIETLPQDIRLIMSKPMFTRIADLASPQALHPLAYYSSEQGVDPHSVPPPRPDFEVRPVLHSDVPVWGRMPREAEFLHAGYGNPRAVIARGMAVGAFNGRVAACLATANVGRYFASIQVYTVPRFRKKGLAKHCLAEMIDLLRPMGVRPLVAVEPGRRSAGQNLVRHLGLVQVGERATVFRGSLAI